ncbi:DUF58 domain-containing protein [Microbacterium sp. JB110]|uniref:DUF58 domain-containing protein n=1 Tax=Microbacterium sp. JB110 TaxID=2024477 RepID=UPI00097EE72B|nr:DUF58 domain-containing protein [Microbacterium sp. JB110]RCS59065.1 DUF58 domain-containing protein [Microbacterium sp. JB110]SJM68564.1 POSSIBLE CONSERVED MEMBRANE PROTEIN [Frigoribacterium sp. JB110]
MFLTGRSSIVVAVGIIPVVLLSAVGADPWLVAWLWVALCVVLAWIDVLAAADPRGLIVSRDVPQRAKLSDPVRTRIRFGNPTNRRISGRVRDAWQPTAGAQGDRMAIDVPAGESRTVAVSLLPRRRGELRSEFVVVRAAGPLGIAGKQRSIAAPGAIRVLPPFHARRHLASRVARLKELDGNTSIQVRGQGTEFDSLREYVRGDDVRSIDWRATARAGTTMLRTWRPERDRHVVIVIDSGRTAATRVGDGTRLDAAFESALLLSALANRAGDHVHLVAFDRAVRARVTGVDGPGLLPALVDALAPVEAQLIDTDWDAAFAQARSLYANPSLLVVLTAQEAPDAARGFLGTLGTMVRAGTVVLVGTATDTGLDDLALGTGTSDEMYRAAAAEAALASAAQVANGVQRSDADAIADTPDDLPPRIADRYLSLKKAGRL